MKKRPWDRSEYMDIASARYDRGRLRVNFRNGDTRELPAVDVVFVDARNIRWDELYVGEGDWLYVPSDTEVIEIPGDVIRIRTDEDYRAYIEQQNAEWERRYGAASGTSTEVR